MLNDLSAEERAQVITLAVWINDVAPVATREQLAEALSKLGAGVEEALAPQVSGNSDATLLTVPAAPVSFAGVQFDAISVRVFINGISLDVAVPEEMFDKSRSDQTAIAGTIRGAIGTRDQNLAVANYLLDREACGLLAKERADTITEEQRVWLERHREKWTQDTEAKTRAEGAGEITDEEAALLKVYRHENVRDTAGWIYVANVLVITDDIVDYAPYPFHGALVVRPSAESK